MSKGERSDHGETPELRAADHRAHIAAAAQKKIAEIQALSEVAGKITDGSFDLLKMLAQAAMANPLIGMALAAIVVDMLDKAGLIRTNTALMIDGIIIGAVAVDLGVTVVTSLEDALPWKFGTGGPTTGNSDIYRPTLSVLGVDNGGGGKTPSLVKTAAAASLPMDEKYVTGQGA